MVPMGLACLLGRDGFGPASHISDTLSPTYQTRDSQVPREIDVKSILDGQVVTEQLQRNHVQQSLQAVYSFGYADRLNGFGDTFIILVAKDDRLRFAGGDLSKGGLNFGVKRVLGHDDDDRHVLVNQSQRAMFQFTSEDT
jgi:hypothetical protein